MATEEQLQKQIEEYQKVAKENKNVDVGLLMLNALENADKNSTGVPSKSKRWAYLVSLGAPPLGLFFALKYYFGEQDDGKHVAYVCIILTVIGGILAWALFSSALSGSNTSLNQIEQINPQMIHSTLR